MLPVFAQQPAAVDSALETPQHAINGFVIANFYPNTCSGQGNSSYFGLGLQVVTKQKLQQSKR